jgi:hypothetical protein
MNLRTKRNFLLFSILAMGSGSALILLWNFAGLGDASWWLFLCAIALSGGWIFGLLLWHLWAAPNFNLGKEDHER